MSWFGISSDETGMYYQEEGTCRLVPAGVRALRIPRSGSAGCWANGQRVRCDPCHLIRYPSAPWCSAGSPPVKFFRVRTESTEAGWRHYSKRINCRGSNQMDLSARAVSILGSQPPRKIPWMWWEHSPLIMSMTATTTTTSFAWYRREPGLLQCPFRSHRVRSVPVVRTAPVYHERKEPQLVTARKVAGRVAAQPSPTTTMCHRRSSTVASPKWKHWSRNEMKIDVMWKSSEWNQC